MRRCATASWCIPGSPPQARTRRNRRLPKERPAQAGLPFDGCERTFAYVVAVLPRHGDRPAPSADLALEVTMAPLRPVKGEAVRLQYRDDLPDFHDCTTLWRQASASRPTGTAPEHSRRAQARWSCDAAVRGLGTYLVTPFGQQDPPEALALGSPRAVAQRPLQAGGASRAELAKPGTDERATLEYIQNHLAADSGTPVPRQPTLLDE